MEERVSQVTVGKWGKNLAIRLPGEIVKAGAQQRRASEVVP